MDETYEMAGQLAAGPPLAISMMKKSVYQGMSMDIRTQLEQTSSHMAVLFATEDHQEALNAFRSEEHTSEIQSIMRSTYAVFCLKKRIKLVRELFKRRCRLAILQLLIL